MTTTSKPAVVSLAELLSNHPTARCLLVTAEQPQITAQA